MHNSIPLHLLNFLDQTKIHSVDFIQNLWSDYGQIASLEDSVTNKKFIIKQINLEKISTSHPKGWNTNTSHQRKVKSYLNEINWYKNYSQSFQNKIPTYYDSYIGEKTLLLLLNDIRQQEFFPFKNYEQIHIRLCIEWLAELHAYFINSPQIENFEKGNYWHLQTRKDEYNQMCDQKLKSIASTIDKKINKLTFETIIHGDAKIANFHYNQNTNQVMAYDFQYIGKGCGLEDIIYLLSSTLSSDDLYLYADELIQYYFSLLESKLHKLSDKDISALLTEWNNLIPFIWADFNRFLNGWSPDHWKAHAYTKEQTKKVYSLIC